MDFFPNPRIAMPFFRLGLGFRQSREVILQVVGELSGALAAHRGDLVDRSLELQSIEDGIDALT